MEYGKDTLRVGVSRHGLGVFAVRSFKRGDQIGPIEGTIVEDGQYGSDYCMELGTDGAIEPDAPFRFLNHCCCPNCALVEFEFESEDGTTVEPELWVEAETRIEAGEELTIDYAWPAKSAIPCSCGSKECRGWIVAEKELAQVARPRRR